MATIDNISLTDTREVQAVFSQSIQIDHSFMGFIMASPLTTFDESRSGNMASTQMYGSSVEPSQKSASQNELAH